MRRLARLAALFPSSFLYRALLATFCGITGSVLLVTVVFILISRSEFQTQLGLRAASIADFAASQSEFPILVGDRTALDRIAQTVLGNVDVLFVIINDSSGKGLVAVSRKGIPPQQLTVTPVCIVNTSGGKISVLEMCRQVAAPVAGGLFDWESSHRAAGAIGSVRIGFSTAGQNALFEHVVYSGAGIAFTMLCLITVAYALLLRRLVRPLKELSQFAKDVGEGDLTRRTEAQGKDEVAQVSRAFNSMVEKLESTMVSKSYVDEIIRSMGDSLMVVDMSGQVQTVNDATCALLGYSSGELVGLPASAIVEGKGSERTYRTKSGAHIPVLFSRALLREAQGEVWLAQDITEAKRVQEELLAAKEAAEEGSRTKTLFLATMSHELKTPLNAIIGYGEMLEEVAAERGQTDMREDLLKILKAAKHLLEHLNAALAISKLEAGRMEMHATAFDLQELVSDVISTVRPLADKNGCQIEVTSEDPGGVLFTDEMKFRQSLLNLMSNACKFTNHGKVSLAISREVRDDTECVRIDVRDTGIGIAPEHMPKLFVPFSQVDPSHARRYGGTGLGLAISRRLCQMMGGNILAESTPGKGSVFTMTVPVRAN